MIITTAAERAEALQWLREARQALHKLNMGQSAKVFVDQNGERIEYNSASVGQLTKYIRELEIALGLGGGVGPMGVYL